MKAKMVAVLLGGIMVFLSGCVTLNDLAGEHVATINGVDIRQSTDEFTGGTTYTTFSANSNMSGAPHGPLMWHYSTRDVYFAQYWRVSTSWLFPDRVLWLVDGDMEETPIIRVVDNVLNSGIVEEKVYIAVTRAQLDAIADAGEVKISVRGKGNDEWSLRRKDQDAIDALLLYVDSL